MRSSRAISLSILSAFVVVLGLSTASAQEFPLLQWPFTAAQAKSAQEALAKSLSKKVIEKNSLGIEFVLIPPGRFTMGSPSNETNRDHHEDQVEVTLTSPFWLGKTEVIKVNGKKSWARRRGKGTLT